MLQCTSFEKPSLWFDKYVFVPFSHLKSSVVSRHGSQIFYTNYSTPVILSALTLCHKFSGVTLLHVHLPVCRSHLWVLVVSWHGWPMSLSICMVPGLKYSSAVSAAGFVTAGVDI